MTPTQSLATQLIDAHHTHTLIDSARTSELKLADVEEARVVQQLVLAELGTCAGYKIGAGSPEAEPQYAPLPASRVFGAATGIRLADYARVGLELEIAFSFAQDIDQSFAERTEDALDFIDTMSVVVEVVDSRFEAWPKVNPLLQLADLQNNGALVIGDTRPYDRTFDFASPQVTFRCGDHEIFSGRARHPAGDPRRLVAWLVAQTLRSGHTIAARTVLTTGSYTPLYMAKAPGTVRGEIEGFGSIEFKIA
ncbi:fumarylacetoacetate hydrolase family protein [Trinickia sp. LjRoot230]|uniref:2-keto-4-pentenoate hydratase n=1 Tax=Trinickia sp. LjRoot230 TaxID=3342288 RepID=UPI003ECF0878